MSSFAHSIAHQHVREASRTGRKTQLRAQRFVAHMNARWGVITKQFPQHRFYVKSVLPEETARIRAEGIREVIAVPWTASPHKSWWEIVPLEQLTTVPDSDDLSLFGLKTGVNERTPIKLHPNFTVKEEATPPVQLKPSQELVASLSEVTQILKQVEEAAKGSEAPKAEEAHQ